MLLRLAWACDKLASNLLEDSTTKSASHCSVERIDKALQSSCGSIGLTP